MVNTQEKFAAHFTPLTIGNNKTNTGEPYKCFPEKTSHLSVMPRAEIIFGDILLR
jgi:hypothetical protein